MAYNVTNTLTLDVRNKNPQVVRAKQYDKNTRKINIRVVDGDTVYNLDGYTVYFKAKTPDHRAVLKKCTINSDGTATIILDDDILNADGRIKSEIEIVDNTGVLSTMCFDIQCVAAACKDSDITGSKEFSALTDALIRVEALEVNVNTNEVIRQENESTREANETIRQNNEVTRQENESTRKVTMNQIEEDLAELEAEINTVVLKKQLGVPSTSSMTGVATLNNNGKIPESQLPSFVDDVLEGTAQDKTQTASGGYSATGFILTGKTSPCTPESGKIYVDTTDLIQYRWSGSAYISIGSHLALGTTASTAFPGDKGKKIMDKYVSSIKGNKETVYRKGDINLTPANLGASKAEDTHTNLIKPTLGTTTVNGVTCTANGDGIYTLNGTASADAEFNINVDGESRANCRFKTDGTKYKLVGCPSDGSADIYMMNMYTYQSDGTTVVKTWLDIGDGYSSDFGNLEDKYAIVIRVNSGQTVTNLVFKPMLTTDLSATYDDFVQYSGDGELNQNVASLYKHHVTGVKGSAEMNYREGNVNITKSNIGLGNVDNTADANKHVAYATTSGNGVSSMTNDGEEITITLNNGNNVKVPARAGEIGVEVTWAEYQALTEEEKNNGNVYYITDYPSGYTSLKEVINHTRTNLLSPTLGTTTVNGVTCTANEDGTYTLNGTATSDGLFVIRTEMDTLELPKTYKLVGCPSGGSSSTFELNTVKIVGTSRSVFATDRGNGAIIEYVSGATYEVRIMIANNAVLDNVVFKPMLTTDLSATYDDFVQYSGDGELNQNVASLYNMFFDIAHPVGELYITKNASFNPNTAKGWHGTWVRDKGTFVRLADDDDAIGSTGGSDSRTLTVENLPSHAHGLNNHVHSLNNHTHSLNGHTHIIPALSGIAARDGKHQHYAVVNKKGGYTAGAYGNANPNYGIGVYNDGAGDQSYTLFNADISDMKENIGMWTGSTNSEGDHIHSVTTTASTTGGNSGNTGGNSGNTGGASGNTTTTGSGTAFDNRPYHINYYGWIRTA